jgi:hypothetical protein
MKRYNITTTQDTFTFAGNPMQNSMKTSDGNYRGVINVEDDMIDDFEDFCEESNRVIAYQI